MLVHVAFGKALMSVVTYRSVCADAGGRVVFGNLETVRGEGTIATVNLSALTHSSTL